MLKLNPDKTEFCVFGNSKERVKLLPFFPTDILGNLLTPVDCVKNLGYVFDSNLTMARQISAVTKSSFYHIRDLRRLSRFLPRSTIITLANALVSSRLDYCNSLFYGITAKQLRRLQSVQSTLCRIIFRGNRFSSVTPYLKELHWLPVKHRIQFKLGLLTYNAINTSSPAYLFHHINRYSSSRNIRRSDSNNLILDTPFYNSTVHNHFSYFSHSFSYSAPRLWNSFPLSVRSASSSSSFRHRLKGYLFNLAFF